MLILFSHTGWERIGYSAGEMKNPKRVIPLSLIVGISIVVSLYALTNMTYHRTLGIEGMRESTIVASDVLTILIGPIGAALIAILVIISASGSINGTMMTAPRVYYAMAKDGLFFKWLDFVHPRFRTPSRAIAAHCLWAGAILLIRGTFETIATGLVFTILIFYGLSSYKQALYRSCHCECNEAISSDDLDSLLVRRDCFALLAMTGIVVTIHNSSDSNKVEKWHGNTIYYLKCWCYYFS